MASTSSTPPPLLWTYDVFLSFRGEDTRKTFVDHLYTALVQQGIHTYKDDETLPRGDLIAHSLLKAIQESRIALIVFSKNYAESSWCLDELECIVKCSKERGQIVYPIFYDVEPSDVRKQTGEFGAAFDKHLKNDNKVETPRKRQRGDHGKALVKYGSENNIKVKSWRDALRFAADFAGFRSNSNGHESEFIQIIVNKTSDKLFHLLSSNDTNLVGIGTRKQDLKALLQVGSSNVCMVGIWGIGGGGKSTLARSVFEELSSDFNGYCFLRNIGERSRRYNLESLQREILADVLGTYDVDVQHVQDGMRMIKSRLFHRKVFIVLDDVDDVNQLEALAGSRNWFGPGSRIIITSRDQHLLSSHNVDEIYNMPLLNDEEAIELFSRYAFQSSRPIEGFKEISRKVVFKVRGLPLALKVLGTSLRNREMSEWISMLDRLEDDPHNLITATLKSGFDGFLSSEKEIFLDIACFYTLRPIDRAIMMRDACGYHPLIGVKVLIEKALITVSNGRFYVHDLLQDLARNIVRDKYSNSPEKQTRVWQKEDVLNICAVDVTKENDMNIEAIRLDPFIDDPPQCLPDVVAHMKKLRWLYWEGYPATSLPASFQPRNLCCLVLEDGLQKQLWRGSKVLPCLKVLDLRDSYNLIKTPDFLGFNFLKD